MTTQPSDRWTRDLQVDKDHAYYGSAREMQVQQITRLRAQCQEACSLLTEQPSGLSARETSLYFAAQQHLVKLERDLLDLDIREHERLLAIVRAQHNQAMELGYPHSDEFTRNHRATFDAYWRLVDRVQGHYSPELIHSLVRPNHPVNFTLASPGNSEVSIPLELDLDTFGNSPQPTIRFNTDWNPEDVVTEALAASWAELTPEHVEGQSTDDRFDSIMAKLMTDAQAWWSAAYKHIEARAMEYAITSTYYSRDEPDAKQRQAMADGLIAEANSSLHPKLPGEPARESEVLGLGNF